MSKLKFAPSIEPCLCVAMVTNTIAWCCSLDRSRSRVKGTGDDQDPSFSVSEPEKCTLSKDEKSLCLFRHLCGTMAECVPVFCITVPMWSSVSCGTSLSKTPCYLCSLLGVRHGSIQITCRSCTYLLLQRRVWSSDTDRTRLMHRVHLGCFREGWPAEVVTVYIYMVIYLI